MREMLTFTFFGLIWLFVVFLMFASPVRPAEKDWKQKAYDKRYVTTFKGCHNLCSQARIDGFFCKCQKVKNKFKPYIIH
jgi:hypothetical protein